jgi:hypothetical protein
VKNTRAAHPTGSINVRPTPEKKKVFLIKRANDYKIVMNGKTFFWAVRPRMKERKIHAKMTKAALTIALGTSLAVNTAAQVGNNPEKGRPEVAPCLCSGHN